MQFYGFHGVNLEERRLGQPFTVDAGPPRQLLESVAGYPIRCLPDADAPKGEGVSTMLGQNEVIIVTTDTVPGHRVVKAHGLITGKDSDGGQPAESYIIDEAVKIGANAVVDFRLMLGANGKMIGYGTAVTIE